MVKRLAIIPARGGSKRIPRKNIIEFCGKPMIAWTIEAAIHSNLFDTVMVSTECQEIAEIAVQYGASVPFLRESHFDDHSTVSDAIVAAIQQLSDSGLYFDQVAQLMANCPIRDATDIQRATEYFDAHEHRFQISCFQFGWMNPWWAVELDCQNTPKALFPKALKTRSQDLPDLYCPTGAIWMAEVVALLEAKTFYGPGHRFFPLSWQSAVDIDDYEDLSMAKSVMQNLREELPK